MANCNSKIIEQGVSFAMLARTAYNKPAFMPRILNSLNNSLVTEPYDAVVLMKLIEATFKAGLLLNETAVLDKIKAVETSADIDAFIKDLNIDKETIDENLAMLRSIKGFESFKKGVSTLNTMGQDKGVSTENETTVEVEVEDTGVGLTSDLDISEKPVFTVDDHGVEMLRKKNIRIEKSKDLSKNSPEYWTAFLGAYFQGLSSFGVEFTTWAKDTFYDELIDFTDTRYGVETDINKKINDIKTDLKAKLLNTLGKHSKGPNNVIDLSTKFSNKDKSVRNRYFTEVLITDFDYVLNTLIKSIVVSPKDTKRNNTFIDGFINEEQDPLPPKLLNFTGLEKLTEVIKGNKSKLKDTDKIDNTMRQVELNTLAFINDTTLPTDSFYHLVNDDMYFFRDVNGVNTDISPVSIYSYDSSSKRNVDSIDHFIDPTDSSSSFINNIMPIFKLITKDAYGKEELGRRLTGIDFLTLSPFLINAGSDIDDFIKNLKKLSEKDTTIQGKLAKSLLVQVFDKKSFNLIENKEIYSLYQAAHKDESIRGSLNEDIIKALHSALINKDHIQYMKVEEGRTTITKGVEDKNNASIVNDGLAGFLMEGNATKKPIADKIIVRGTDISVIFSNNIETPMSSITNVNQVGTELSMRAIAESLGLGILFEAIYNEYAGIYNTATEANKAVLDTFNKIIRIAAANKKVKKVNERLKLSTVDTDKGFEHENYLYLTPNAIIQPNELNNLSRIFIADTTQNITIAGKKNSSMTTPNRDAYVKVQVKTYNQYNKTVNKVHFTFNPFLDHNRESTIIPKATIKGVTIKTSIMNDGEPIGLSEWDLKTRVQHAIISGFIQGPKSVGTEFYLQPINYSDKSTPEMFHIKVDKNLLDESSSVSEMLKEAYIEYNLYKNLELQLVMIQGLSDFILGSYEEVKAELNGDEARIKALVKLKDYLKKEDYKSDKVLDKVREVNRRLAGVKLSPDFFMFSSAIMDKNADYISLPGDKEIAILKPNLGIRATKWGNPKVAATLVEEYLDEHARHLTADLKIDEGKIINALKATKTTGNVKTARDIYDRVFLINGIYGHGIKVLTMGDETYFPGWYGTDETLTIKKYYDEVDNGTRTGLEEHDSMLKNQFKRAQSELTRGNVYSQISTMVGLKRNSGKDNLLQYLNIRDSKDVIGELVYEFDDLMGKTYNELEGLGVISRFEDGSLVQIIEGGISVKFNNGPNETVFGNASNSVQDILDNKSEDIPRELAQGVSTLLTQIKKNSDVSATDSSVNTAEIKLGHISNPLGRVEALTLQTILDQREKTRNNRMVLMPDFTPSVTLTDPVSYINLLNSMNKNQDNSDAIQFIHPLMAVIMKHARGNDLGAFNTEHQEAIKTLTTTFEYDKMRQVLQKKSVQNPFTEEQMEKLGSAELYNVLKKLNTAIPFTQRNITYTPVFNYGNGPVTGTTVTGQFDNMQALYEKVFNDPKYRPGTDAIWETIMDILRQNPENMHSFVGLISVPSNQKTGHKKINKFKGMFTKDYDQDAPLNIDYTANEFNFEVLTKAHEYDVSGKLHAASALTLLSQLVNAVSFGGLSNINSKNLQNAMMSKMMLNGVRVGKDLASVAEGLAANDADMVISPMFIARLNKGSVNTDSISKDGIDELFSRQEIIDHGAMLSVNAGYYESIEAVKDVADNEELLKKGYADLGRKFNEADQKAYVKTMRKGVYEMARLAFQKNDSVLIEKIIRGTKGLKDEDGNEIDMISYSLDAPSVRSKVLGTLRSSFFKDTVKMQMSGFIGTVSAAHKTITIFTSPSGMRVGRKGYITGMLSNDTGTNTVDTVMGEVVDLKAMDEKLAKRNIMPFDAIAIRDRSKVPSEWIQVPYYTVGYTTNLNDPNIEARAVLTPDMQENPLIDAKRWNELGENTLINIAGETFYKWYLKKKLTTEAIQIEILEGNLEENIEEKYSLRWQQIIKKTVAKDGIKDIKDTLAYRKYYEISLNKESKEKDFERARTDLILETQAKDKKGEAIWTIIQPEVVLPTYVKEQFNIPDGASISDIIGTVKGMEAANAKEWFTKNYSPKPLTYSDFLNTTKRIYTSINAKEGKAFAKPVLEYLKRYDGIDNSDGKIKLSREDKKAIEKIVRDYEANEIANIAENFIKSLEVALTRIPGQSKQSGFMGNVIEFFDGQGNATFAATEHLVNTGGDLDIDTLSVLTKTIGKGGIIEDHTQFVTKDGGFNYKDMLAAYTMEIKQSTETIREAVILSNIEAQTYITENISTVETNTLASEKERYNERLIRSRKNIIDSDQESKIIKGMAGRIHARYQNVISNAIADGIFTALNNVNTAVELNTPISMGMFKPIIKRLELQENKPITGQKSGENYMAIFEYEDLAAQGKEAIGIFATVLKINSAIQAAKINFDHNYKDKLYAEIDNPFNFKNKLSFVGPDGKVVNQMRTGFADLDRFAISQSVEKSSRLQAAVKSILKRQTTNDANAVATIVALLEDSIIKAIHVAGNTNKAKALDLMQKQQLGQIQGNNSTNFDIGVLLGQLLDTSSPVSEDIADRMSQLFGVDNINGEGRAKVVEILEDTYVTAADMASDEAKEYATNTAKTLFGIDLPTNIANSKDIIAAFSTYLKKDSNATLVSDAFVLVMGKQLSNDIQSQFLSAATDNAKELILGKIKSNSLTNPVITTMMLLGYDTDTIIDFLYDKDISRVFDHFLRQKSKLEQVRVTPYAIKVSGVAEGSAAVASLIEILEIGERVSKFRALRSLNENAQIEQHKLDRILFDLGSAGKQSGSSVLYKAIISNNINALQSLSKSSEAFNTAMTIFLHPQSNALFRNIYESENFKLPALSRVVTELRLMIDGKVAGQKAYKNINSYISTMQVISFLNSEGKDGKVRTGSITIPTDKGYTTSIKPLNNKKTRKEFVENFSYYLQHTKEKLASIKEDLKSPGEGIAPIIIGENSVMDMLGSMRIFGGKNPVLGFNKLKNSDVSNIDTALIYEGINELRMKTGIKELDDLNQELHNNLAHYALIVSSGEIKKGTMIEVYREINLELAEFVNNMTEDDYAKFRLTDLIGMQVVQDNIQTDDKLTKTFKNKNKALDLGENIIDEVEDPLEQGEYVSIYDVDIEDENGNVFSKKIRKYSNKVELKIFKGSYSNVGEIFRTIDPYLKDALFYTPKVNEVAYRVFPAGNKEAMPNTLRGLDAHRTGSKVSPKIAENLNKIGLQIGFNAKWFGEDITILGFAGKMETGKGTKKIDHYIISHDEGLMRVAGLYLMEDNDNLFLNGNIIEEIYNGNRYNVDILRGKYESLKNRVTNTPIILGNIISKKIAKLYGTANIDQDPILSREYIVAGSKPILKINDRANLRDSFAYNSYYSLDEFPAANIAKPDPEVFIPSFNTDVLYQGELKHEIAFKELGSKAMDIVSNLGTASEITFYGLRTDPDLKRRGTDILVGGIDVLVAAINRLKPKKGTGGEITFSGGAYSYTTGQDAGMNFIKITRKKDNKSMVSVNNIIHTFTTVTNEQGMVSFKETPKNQVKLKALETDIVTDVPFKIIKASIKGFSNTLIVLNPKSDTRVVYVKRGKNEFDSKYFKLTEVVGADGVTSGGNFNVNKNIYSELMSIINKDNSDIRNKSC